MNASPLAQRPSSTRPLVPLWSQSDAQRPDAPPALPCPRGSEALKSAAPLVLLVEDNLINQVVAQEFLSLMGLQCHLAGNGLEALTLCQQTAPDLVLMDIQMPGMDGLECARRIRALQRAGDLADFPILALTAHALDSDVRASLDAGMDEHLTKPLDFMALRLRLGRWLRLPELPAQP
ncbi:MAG: response regulator [Burkholderiaceae bacterium]|nr:response regulator [Burkholderiaceae bacterium]